MGVTPAILAAAGVESLLTTLEGQSRRGWVDRLARPARRRAWQRLTPRYSHRWNWTEYTLYYLHIENSGGAERWHFRTDAHGRTGMLYSANSVWFRTNAEPEELAERIADPDDPSLFMIFQSNAAVDLDLVRRAVAISRGQLGG